MRRFRIYQNGREWFVEDRLRGSTVRAATRDEALYRIECRLAAEGSSAVGWREWLGV